jgi:PAS domain S-box-containing protein
VWWEAVTLMTAVGAGGIVFWGVLRHRTERDAETRQRAHEAGREAAIAELDGIFEHVTIGLALFDRELRYVRVNDRLAEMNGLPVEAHIGRRVSEVLPGLPSEVEADVRRVLETGEPLSEVYVSGSTPARPEQRDWMSSYFPVRERGTVVGVGCVVRDVTERQQAQRELRAQTDRYEALLLALSEAGEGMLVLERDGRCVYANAAFEHLSGYPFPELAALDSVLELVLPEHRADARRRAELRVAEGLVDTEYELTMRRRDGQLVDLEVVGVPLQVEGRHRMVVVAHDVTERRRLEEERERALRRSALTAEASELFDQTLDEAGTLERVARLCVRDLAMTCVVVVGEGPTTIQRVAAAARDPQIERMLLEMQLRYPLDESPGPSISETLLTGEAQVLEAVSDHLDAAPMEDRHRGLVEALGSRAALIVPMRARGAMRGALALGFATLDGHDRNELITLFEDIGRRAALAIDTARLYEERTAVAETLQRSLLPPTLPEVPGMDIAARFLAARGNEVGGDFYDCFPTRPGEWAAVIGDVCGKGAEAATVTALARHTIRAAVVHDPAPARVLSDLNAAILRHEPDYRFCTVLYVRLVLTEEGVEACVATGGHPLPLLLRASGTVETVGRPGTLIGVVSHPEFSETSVTMRPGDALVLFTDGVIEASPVDDAFGPEQLARFLGECVGSDAGHIAAGVEGRVVELQRGRPRDDVAVVVLRVAPGARAPGAPAEEGLAARS